jgi:type 1 glutamine amidotransferase
VPTTRIIAVFAVAVAVASLGAASSPATAAAPGPRVLLFTKTAGFRHASIPVATQALRSLGSRNGLAVEATEDAAAFTDDDLRRFDAVVFLLTTGDVLDDRQQAAFERYIRAGGGYAGVHSASDTEYDWPWYGRLVGAYFRGHPEIQRATVAVADGRHSSTVDLPRRWVRTDEWYAFRRNPRGAVHVLATLDETTYQPGEHAMGGDHPIAWSHGFEGGRAWYTAGGHTHESYAEPLFLAHLLGGIRWAVGLDPPRIAALAATLRDRRLTLTFRSSNCRRCEATVAVRLRGRTPTASVAVRSNSTRLVGPSLPRGRWEYSLVLRDRSTGLKDRLRRSVLVP